MGGSRCQRPRPKRSFSWATFGVIYLTAKSLVLMRVLRATLEPAVAVFRVLRRDRHRRAVGAKNEDVSVAIRWSVVWAVVMIFCGLGRKVPGSGDGIAWRMDRHVGIRRAPPRRGADLRRLFRNVPGI